MRKKEGFTWLPPLAKRGARPVLRERPRAVAAWRTACAAGDRGRRGAQPVLQDRPRAAAAAWCAGCGRRNLWPRAGCRAAMVGDGEVAESPGGAVAESPCEVATDAPGGGVVSTVLRIC